LALVLGLAICTVWAATPAPAVPGTPPAAQPAPTVADPALVEEGRRLYAEGLRADGSELLADRQDAQPLHGERAACVMCHKRSGMGGIEGDVIVPPINGPALYAGSKLHERVVVSMDPRRGRFFNPSHPPYDAASLAAAIRDGTHVTGRPMHVLMPRYRVTDHELAALKAYLDQLSTHYSPGVTDKTARFATVIAPGVSAERKDAFLKTLNTAFMQKNANYLPGHRHMISASEGMLNLERSWSIDVWELSGPPETWNTQLQQAYDKAPVFALISGLGDGEWGPVQAFCERGKIPCWFPSVINPPDGADHQTYSLYFTQGVALEAGALAQYFSDLPPQQQPHKVVQVRADDATGRAAEHALSQALPKGMRSEVRVWHTDGDPKMLLDGLGEHDALVLWLDDLAIGAVAKAVAPTARVYGSTMMSHARFDLFPAAWLSRLQFVYPYELPEKRLYNLATFHSWLQLYQVPLVDEAMQSEVYFSIAYLNFTMTDMLDNVYRDCLIDRGETMVRRREMLRAEEEIMVRQGGHPPAKSTQARSTLAPGALYGLDPNSALAQKRTPKTGVQQGTTIYPRLDMATGQRFASKGAYLVHVSETGQEELIHADSEWIVP
jgi:cytochrome c553